MNINNVDRSYMKILRECMEQGDSIVTRNDEVRRIIAHTTIFDSTPLVGVRKTSWKSALREWEWFMSGSDNINDLHPSVHSWWKPWADSNGSVKNNYSSQFRKFHGKNGYVNQIQELIDGITHHPFSRRNVITTWNTCDMVNPSTPITNCHGTLIQVFVGSDAKLTLTMHQRSCDMVCGVPHNWIQYWAFLLWLSHKTGWSVGKFVWIGGDVHVYKEHFSIVQEILQLQDATNSTPQLMYVPSSEDFKADDFSLDKEYTPLLLSKARMVV